MLSVWEVTQDPDVTGKAELLSLPRGWLLVPVLLMPHSQNYWPCTGTKCCQNKVNSAGTSTLLISALHQPRRQTHSVSSHSLTLRSFRESMGLLLLKDTQVASAQPCLKSKLVHAFPPESFGRNNSIEGQLEDFDKKKNLSRDKAIKVLTVLLPSFLSKILLWKGIRCLPLSSSQQLHF